MINLRVNYLEVAFMIQNKIGAQHDSNHLMQIRLYFHLRKPLKKFASTKDHIATIFNPFMTGGNKRVYKTNLQLKVCLTVDDV